MPRKLLSDCERGWYGWESHSSSVLRLSNCCLWDCRQKMDMEKFRHHEHMQRLEQLQKTEELLSKKALRSVQDEYSRIRAEQTVLHQYAFTNYDPSCEDPPQPPHEIPSPPPRILLPRRPKTERTPCSSAVNRELLKRNSLPSLCSTLHVLSKDSGSLAPHKNKNSVQASASGCSSTPGKKTVIPDIVAPLKRLPKVKGRRRSGRLPAESEEGFFLTQSGIMRSAVIEEEEEKGEGDDEVFYGQEEQAGSELNDTSATSDVWGQGERQNGGPGYREGIQPREHSFQNIDYILGARKQSVRAPGTLTSTHLAKPTTPRETLRPPTHKDSATSSGNKEVYTAPNQNPSRVSSHKQSNGATVPESKVPELSRSLLNHVQPDGKVSQESHTRLSLNSTVDTDPAPHKAVHVVPSASSRGYNTRTDSPYSSIPQKSDPSSEGTHSNEPRSHAHEPGTRHHEPGFHKTRTNPHQPEPRIPSHKVGSHHHESRTPLNEPGSHSHKPGPHPHELESHLRKPGPHHDSKNRITTTTTTPKMTPLHAKDPVPAISSSASSSSSPPHRSSGLLDEQKQTEHVSHKSTLLSRLRGSVDGHPVTDHAFPKTSLLSGISSPVDGHTKSDHTSSKSSLLSKFREAAEVVLEEVRYERETDASLFAALLLNRPYRQAKIRQLEKPVGVALQENEDLWKGLLANVHKAVRLKAKALRESQGLPNSRQIRRKAREQQLEKVRARRHVFPGQCKTSYAMKKFLNKQVDQLVEAWRPENWRKHRNDLLRERATLPEFVDRVRTTTAILRDFKQYQDSQADENVHV